MSQRDQRSSRAGRVARIATTPMGAGAMALVVGLSITGIIAALHGWARFIDYDARYYRIVAGDLDASHASGQHLAYRYGRIGLPTLARLLSLGSIEHLDVTLTVVTPLAFAVLVAGAVAVATRIGRPPVAGLVVLLVPGIWYGFAYALADVLLAACAVLVVWATLADRGRVAVGAIMLAALTKEVGVVCSLPSAVAAYRAGDRRGAVQRLLALAPLGLWWIWVLRRSGELPLLADDPARSSAISPPLVGILRALTGGPGDGVAALLALLVGMAGVLVLVRAPRHPLAWNTGVWAALTLCLGTNVLKYPPDAIRVMTPAMCVVALGLLLLPWPQSTDSSASSGLLRTEKH